MRIVIPVLFVAFCLLPIGALVWNQSYFPDKIQQNLNESAQNGDLSAVQQEASRLSTLYPIYEKKIAAYVKNVVKPAARVTSVANEMAANKEKRTGKTNFGSESPQGFNDLDVGAESFAAK